MARLAPSRPAACDCEVHQLMQLPQAACRRACARHLARSESAADCPSGRLFSAVRRQGPGAGCNSCTLPIRVVGEDGKSYPERRRISARSAFPESNPDGSGPPSRLRSLTWIRCRTPPFLLLPIPRFVRRWPAVVGLSARRRGHRQPDRLGLAVHSRASVLRTVFEPDRVGGRVRCAQPPLSKKDRIDFGALDRPQHAVRLDRRPRAGAARSRATDQAVARGGGQWRSRSGAARSRSVRAGLTRCACRRPVWRNGRSAVVMAQRSPPSSIPPSSAIPTPPTEPTGIVVVALVHEITRTTLMFRHDTDGRRRVFTSATYAVSSVLRGLRPPWPRRRLKWYRVG